MIVPNSTLCREIAEYGILPFARFMELALYAPGDGYYERQISPGQCGDFYTSVSVGGLFGQLLAFRFSLWLDDLKARNPQITALSLCEAGAHDGTLAKDILNWLQFRRPALFERIEYVILEPSARRREWQQATLKLFTSRIRWVSGFDTPKLLGFNGIIFSNELLDAMPVRRFGWDARSRQWFEWGVARDGGKFVWARCSSPLSPLGSEKVRGRGVAENLPPLLLNLPGSLLDLLPDNYSVEVSPAAEKWWCDATNALERGWLLTFDYGLTTDELLSPSRPRGTLRAYHRHQVSDDILSNPGEQDITAHVNFSAIRKVGEDAGLMTEFFGRQAKFLTEILASAATSPSFGGWGNKQTRQFQTLTHPEHLGHLFRVLVQSR